MYTEIDTKGEVTMARLDGGVSGIERRRQTAREADSIEYRARQRQIESAAIKVLAENGGSLERVRLEDIASLVGISRSSLYYYVGDKAALYGQIFSMAMEENVRLIEEVRDSDLPAEEKLSIAIAALMTAFGNKYPLLYTYSREDLRHSKLLDKVHARRILQLSQRYDKALVDIVESGLADGTFDSALSAKVTSYGIVGMLAWTHRWFQPMHGLSADAIGKGFADMVLRGLLPRKDS